MTKQENQKIMNWLLQTAETPRNLNWKCAQVTLHDVQIALDDATEGNYSTDEKIFDAISEKAADVAFLDSASGQPAVTLLQLDWLLGRFEFGLNSAKVPPCSEGTKNGTTQYI